MKPIRFASSLIITRGSPDELEIYLVQRNPELRFMGGFWAFPGGTVQKEDHINGKEIDDEVFINCGLREMFEETGLLLNGWGNELSAQEKQTIRKELLEETSVTGWMKILGRNRDKLSGIEPVCTITTPPFSPVIYKTRFLHVPITEDNTPVIEQGELVDGRFFKPVDAVATWNHGEIHIAPPNLFLLRLLARYDLDEFKKEAKIQTLRFEKGALHPVYFAPGIFLAPLKTPTLPPATTTNTLIVGNEKLFVVEPATYEKDEQASLFAKMDELIEEGKKFEAILLTHYHMDHVGAVNEVSQRYNLPVRAHPLSYEKIPEGYIKGEALNEGDRIELGTAPDGTPDWHLDVIHTPGHTPDHICYLESRYHSAIIGDLMSTVATILIDPAEGHMQTYLNSLKKLLQYPVKTVFPSHGTVHNDGHALVHKFLKHRQGREDKIVATLSGEPRTIEDILPEAYDDVEEDIYPIAKKSLLAVLIKLQEDGISQQTGDGWQLKTAV